MTAGRLARSSSLVVARTRRRSSLVVARHPSLCRLPGHSSPLPTQLQLSQLSLFLLGNRAHPTLIVEWYMARGMLKDKSAREQVADIIMKHKNGTLESQGRTTWLLDATEDKPHILRKHKWDGVGDPARDKSSVISTPSFAFDWEHEVCV